MMVGELREALEDYPEEAEVHMVHQESWPLEFQIRGVCASNEVADDDPQDPDPKEDEDGNPIVYIVEGRFVGYGRKNCWHSC